MKKLLLVVAMVLSSLAVFAAGATKPAKAAKATSAPKTYLSLADARAQIGKCISDPSLMTKIMKKVSPEDQKELVAAVNEAIVGMPSSNEQKSATFLNVNHAALKGAAKGNLKTIIAEVFATVPPEVLTLLNERFAEDLFSRTSDPSKNYTDAQFEKISLELMKTVNERMASLDNGAARATFVILMMNRASNGTPADLTEKMIKTLPEAAQNEARTEWIPAAMGKQQRQTYEPILGAADALNQMAENNVVMRLAGPQVLEAMLGDVVEGVPLVNNSVQPEIGFTPAFEREERGPNPPMDPSDISFEDDKKQEEPGPYQGQSCNCWIPL